MSEARINSVTPKAPATGSAAPKRQGSASQSAAADPFAAMLAQSVDALDARSGPQVESESADEQAANQGASAETAPGATESAASTALAGAADAQTTRDAQTPRDASALTKELALEGTQRVDAQALAAGPHSAASDAGTQFTEQAAARSSARRIGSALNSGSGTAAAQRADAATKAGAPGNGERPAAAGEAQAEAPLATALLHASSAMPERLAERFAERLDAAGAAQSANTSSAPSGVGAAAVSGSNGFAVQRYEAASPLPQFNIPAPLDTPAWPVQLGQVVRVMSRDELSSAQLRVHPAELGPIEVRLAIEGDRAQIDFTAASPETRALLEAHMPRLREALESTGLQLQQTSVQSGPQGDARQFDPSASGRSDGSGRGTGRQQDEAPAQAVTEIRIGARAERMVDVFV